MSKYDIVAIYIDGKHLGETDIVIARGLKIEQKILFIIDGAKGLYKGIKAVVGEKALMQRCQWHQRENVLSYLPKNIQGKFRNKLQSAYEQPTYEKTKAKLMTIRKELKLINESAAASLDEGLEETLTLHKLGVFKQLGKSFKTTNCIENINRQIQSYTRRVCRWQNSNQRRRWIASTLLEITHHRTFTFSRESKSNPAILLWPKIKNL